MRMLFDCYVGYGIFLEVLGFLGLIDFESDSEGKKVVKRR